MTTKPDPPYLVDEHVYALAVFFVDCAADQGEITDIEDMGWHTWELAKRIQDAVEDYEFK